MTLGEKTFLGPIETNGFRAILGPKKNFKEPLKDIKPRSFQSFLPCLFFKLWYLFVKQRLQ